MDILTSTIDNIAPLKTIRITEKRVIREPWVTKDIMKTSVSLDKLFKKCINMQSDHPLSLDFKSKRNQFNKHKRELNSSISEPLAIIINKSMEQGIFPNQLKLAKIIPIYKSKDKEQFNNYIDPYIPTFIDF